MYSSLQKSLGVLQLKFFVKPPFIPTLLHKQIILKHPLCRYNAHVSCNFKTDEINAQHFEDLITDSEKNDKVSIIVREIQTVIARKKPFPEFLASDHLQELYNLSTQTQRHKYLFFLFKKEKIKIADIEKREKKKKERELNPVEKLRYFEKQGIHYGLGQNCLLLSLRKKSMNKFYSKRLANSVLFGQKIVLDLSYDTLMTTKEKKACIAQLKIVYSVNRENLNPFDLFFCNANPSSKCVQYLKRDLINIEDSFISLTEGNYLDVFPKEKLVYLSPHAKETLKEFDHNAVYIIGAFVDTVKREHVSSHKAETEGIKSYSLPLDDYIMWGGGSKSLTINQVFEIMLTLKSTGDWKKAFEVIPTRKIRKLEPHQIDPQNLPDRIFLWNTSKSQTN